LRFINRTGHCPNLSCQELLTPDVLRRNHFARGIIDDYNALKREK